MWLAHHGVEKMKWGIKNGPPYPLNQTRKEYEKKQDRYLNDDGSLNAAGKKRVENGFLKSNREEEKNPKAGRGENRYVDSEGKLTEAGIKRYSRELKDNARKKKDSRVKDVEELRDPDRWVREDIENVRNVVTSSNDIVRNLKQIERAIPEKKRVMDDYSHLTDKEMRDYINRVNLERQYDEVVNPRTTSRGREYVKKFFEYAEPTLAVTASGLGIALAIRKLSGK